MSDARPHPTVDRLLGPTGPQVSCEECFEQLDHYVELEVRDQDPDARLPGMRAHLRGCPACAEDHDSLLDLVRADDANTEPPDRAS